LVPFKAASHRSQALCFFIKRVDFVIESRHLRLWGIGAAQLFKRLADGEFSCFSHGKSSSGVVEDGKDRANAAPSGTVSGHCIPPMMSALGHEFDVLIRRPQERQPALVFH
jgi:hypothetical protein